MQTSIVGMSYSEEFIHEIRNPAELAITRADVVVSHVDELEISPDEEAALVELDVIADGAGFHAYDYFVEASNAFAIPASFDRDTQVSLHHFEDGLSFEGKLSSFSIVQIGRLAVGSDELRVRSLCLAFGAATLLPYFDRLDDSDILHVPAQAIRHISGQKAV